MIVLVIFGPKRLPGLGRSLGQGMREFKDSIGGGSKDEDDDERELETASARAPAEPPGAAAATDARDERSEPERNRSEASPVDGDVVPDRRP